MPDPNVQSEAVLGLVGLIYDAVEDASRWQIFLDEFVRVTQARGGLLAIRDMTRADFAILRWSGWSDEDIHSYMEHYSATDPWRINSAGFPEGLVASDHELCPREEMESSTAFQEYYAPRDGFHGFGGTILVTGTGQSVISAVRRKGVGPFGEPEKEILRALMPHLKRAAILHGTLGSMRSQLSTFTSHLDRYPHGFLLTDAECRVLYANAAAREIGRLKDGLTIEDGQIVLTEPGADAVLHRAIGKVASDPKGSLLRVEVAKPSGGKPYRLILIPAKASGDIPLGVALPRVSIFIVDGDARREPDVDALRELFSLTPDEARVAGRLVLGRTSREIANETGASMEAVRTDIRRVLSKTGARRRVELISLLSSSVPFRSPDA